MSVLTNRYVLPQSRVYFAHPTNGGPIKVGTTMNLDTRMTLLGAWVPSGIEVVAHVQGGLFREGYLKAALQPFRIQGEWLRSCVEVWRAVDEVARTGNIDWLPAEHEMPRSINLHSAIVADFGNVARFSRHVGRQIQALTPGAMIGSGMLASMWIRSALANESLPAWLHAKHDLASRDGSKWPKGGAIDALFALMHSPPFSVAA